MTVSRADRIYVAGHRGLAGSAIVRQLRAAGFDNLLLRERRELDLVDQPAVRQFFERERPDHVFVAAAKVGGILANDSFPADFIRENLAIQTNVIHEAHRAAVKRLVFLGSSCIYPRDCPQPMKEEYLLTGPLEPTNRPYALAKIAGIEMCWSYNRQFGTKFLTVMPTNLYGPGDNYDLRTSHVLAALLRKAHEAKVRCEKHFVVWGTGQPRREFLHSDDMAQACVFLLTLADPAYQRLVAAERAPLINIGAGTDIAIAELAQVTASVVGFDGKISFDSSKPDGTPRKLLDTSRLSALGWQARTSLRQGLAAVYEEFKKTADRAGARLPS